MKLRHLRIRHFRGIETLEWSVPDGPICLVGPNDSGKTTILDAIQLTLAARWSVTIHDHDFFRRDVDEPIVIDATITDVPDALLDEKRFGLHMRGWSAAGAIHDEPEEDDEPALTVRFQVDESLEPKWSVVTDRDPEGKGLSWRDRQRLGVARLGAWLDRDFRWARGSAITRLSADTDEIDRTIAQAQRKTREAVASADLSQVDGPVKQAREKAEELGAGHVASGFHAALDVTGNDSQLALHSEDIPLASFGDGTKRLTALGLQMADQAGASILLVDEVEHALEPFRLRHVVRTLRAKAGDETSTVSQVLCTTHSNVAVEQFDADQLHVVRRDAAAGLVVIAAVPTELQDHVRRHAEAFLARRVIVCEGSTEVGILAELDDPDNGVVPLALANHGVTLVKGGGSEAPGTARMFHRLGFDTALFIDSDRPVQPTPAELRADGIHVLQWQGSVAVEERLLTDLPVARVAALVDRLAETVGDHVTTELARELGIDVNAAGIRVISWVEADATVGERLPEAALKCCRKASGQARWFKSIRAGLSAGQSVRESWHEISGTELKREVEELLAWATR